MVNKKKDNNIIIKSRTDKFGLVINFQNTDFFIKYPRNIWSILSENTKESLLDNITYAATMHLPLVIPHSSGIKYNTAIPMFEPYFLQNFLKDIPSNTEVDGTNTDEITKKSLQLQYSFEKNSIRTPDQSFRDFAAEKAIVAMSFGKDSLLSYALAEELNLKPEMVYIVESSLTYEEKHKEELGKAFEKEFSKKLHILRHDTGKFRDYKFLNLPKSEIGWGLQSTEYALELLPFSFALNANYIIFGNEQSTSEYYFDQQKNWRIYPCYDQTHYWTLHINQMTKNFSQQKIQTTSLIEPLMDILVQRILIRRYPEYAKYQMSCFTENESGRDYRWCQECSVCGKMYLLAIACGMNPKKIGFTKNMLSDDCKQYFTIFGGKSHLTYLNTGLGRDEQLFAFYLSKKKRASGKLIEIFSASELFLEAKNRFEELRDKFIRIYDPITIPEKLKSNLLSIFKEELSFIEI